MNEDQKHGAYEVSDAKVSVPVMSAVVLAGLVVLAVVLMWLMYGWLADRRTTADVAPSPMAVFREPPPGPRLQVDPPKALTEMQVSEAARLTEYAWVDRENGVVRIPVQRAMDLLVERGLPVRKGMEKKR